MPLSIDPVDRQELQQAKAAVFLGIIRADGQVRLKLSDAVQFPGHAEWLARDPQGAVSRGFSVLVRDGKMWAIFPRSRLNPGDDARLEAGTLEELIRLLPTDGPPQILE